MHDICLLLTYACSCSSLPLPGGEERFFHFLLLEDEEEESVSSSSFLKEYDEDGLPSFRGHRIKTTVFYFLLLEDENKPHFLLAEDEDQEYRALTSVFLKQRQTRKRMVFFFVFFLLLFLEKDKQKDFPPFLVLFLPDGTETENFGLYSSSYIKEEEGRPSSSSAAPSFIFQEEEKV